MKKRQLWVLLSAIILILVTSVWIFRDVLVMYIAPQIPLSRALESAMVSLDERIKESPLPILLQGYDSNGKNTVYAELSDGEFPIGTLQIQSDLEGNQIHLNAAFPEGSRLPRLELYMNRDFAAITSEPLLRGGYYGITYETFSQDLRSIPLASLLISSELKGEWEASVQELQEKMSWKVSLPDIPQVGFEVKPALLALWVTRPDVEVIQLNDPGRMCYQISYLVEGTRAKFLWEKIFKLPYTGCENIRLNCYLYQNSLVQLEFSGTAGKGSAECVLTMAPDSTSLSLDIPNCAIDLTSVQEGEWSSNTIRVNNETYAYQWRSKTGDMVLSLPEKAQVSLNLTEVENGFHIQSNEIDGLMNKNLFKDGTWDVTVTRGANLTEPPYKNLDQWSFEDLLILLDGVWSVFKD